MPLIISNQYMIKRCGWKNILASILCLIIGGISGYIFSTQMKEPKEDYADIRQSNGYNYISPLLECETTTSGNNQKYIPFEADITKKIRNLQEKNKNIYLSIYFRNLNNGPWFGINENAAFSPASLMKLPILFMYLKWKDDDPSILQKVITPTVDNSLNQKYSPEGKIIIGKPYNIADLLYHLIVYSDNTASNALLGVIPQELQDTVYTDLGIPLPKAVDYTISVKEYASFFRMLYNASYLSRNSSESALQLLSLSTFTGGIVGKLPKEVRVAHKFGERETIENNQHINQLHDCGIVYYTEYPYLVCIMTRGDTDMDNLSKIIQDTSKLIFDEIRGIYGKDETK